MLKTSDPHTPNGYSKSNSHWSTLAEIVYCLHLEGIYIRVEQLAEFMLLHGLPVDLQYVPKRLQEKAKAINANYQGEGAQVSLQPDGYEWYVDNLD
jgi:hypothetical protein